MLWTCQLHEILIVFSRKVEAPISLGIKSEQGPARVHLELIFSFTFSLIPFNKCKPSLKMPCEWSIDISLWEINLEKSHRRNEDEDSNDKVRKVGVAAVCSRRLSYYDSWHKMGFQGREAEIEE